MAGGACLHASHVRICALPQLPPRHAPRAQRLQHCTFRRLLPARTATDCRPACMTHRAVAGPPTFAPFPLPAATAARNEGRLDLPGASGGAGAQLLRAPPSHRCAAQGWDPLAGSPRERPAASGQEFAVCLCAHACVFDRQRAGESVWAGPEAPQMLRRMHARSQPATPACCVQPSDRCKRCGSSLGLASQCQMPRCAARRQRCLLGGFRPSWAHCIFSPLPRSPAALWHPGCWAGASSSHTPLRSAPHPGSPPNGSGCAALPHPHHHAALRHSQQGQHPPKQTKLCPACGRWWRSLARCSTR